MTAKEYLSQLRKLDIMINQKQQELDVIHSRITSATASMGGESVIKSKTNIREDNLARYIDLDTEINRDIDYMIDMRHRIIDQIHMLKDSKYIELLFKRYVEFKKFELIAVEMMYDYGTIRHIHAQALNEFEKVITQNHIEMC